MVEQVLLVICHKNLKLCLLRNDDPKKLQRFKFMSISSLLTWVFSHSYSGNENLILKNSCFRKLCHAGHVTGRSQEFFMNKVLQKIF